MSDATRTNPLWVTVALLLGSAILSGVGDILIHRWAERKAAWGLSGGIGLWAAALVLMAAMFRGGGLGFGMAVALLIVIHLGIDVAWDVGVLGTRVSGWQWLGLALAAVAAVLLQVGKGE